MATSSYLGIDLAWGPRARTGIAHLNENGELTASATVSSDAEILAAIEQYCAADVVAAIDAPLIVVNETGRRACEAEVSSSFGAYHAGAHTSNLSKPWFRPQPRGAAIAGALGWTVDPRVQPNAGVSCAIEVYPHPAMVSLFGLDRVIPYKNKPGRDVGSLSNAFTTLMDHMERVLDGVLALRQSTRWMELREVAASATRKVDLGRIEDEVDAIFCAHLAWMWVNDRTALRVYGDHASGYIVSPPPPDRPPRRRAQAAGSVLDQRTNSVLAAEFMRANARLSQHDAELLASIATSHFEH